MSFLYEVEYKNDMSWYLLWEKKVDYYEKTSITLKDKELKSIFPYYIGLSENAIKYCKENSINTRCCFCHIRINSCYDYFSPDNIIIDSSVRDIAEYIKFKFFEEDFNEYELIDFFNSILFKKEEYVLLYARLIFPTYIYDCIELNQNINKYVKKINDYEKLLIKVYYIITEKVDIPKIDWLIKKI